MLASQHRNPDVGIAKIEQRLGKSIHLVTEQDAHGKMRAPVEKVNGVNGGFHRGDLVMLAAELLDERASVGMVLPWNGLVRAQRGFGNGRLGRPPGDSAEVELFAGSGVGCTKEGAYVVKAADIIEQDRDRDR